MTTSIPQTLPLEVALQRAIVHHQAGRLQDAERLYRAILQTQPNHPDANHNLGVLKVQVKQPADGLPHLKAALEANPNQEQYWLSYMEALIQNGQADTARQVLELGQQRRLDRKVLEAMERRLDPNPQEINALAGLFADRRYAEAATLAQSLTMRFPLHGFGWKVLGEVFEKMGRRTEALESKRKAASLMPRDVEAHNNLGNALQDLGQLDDAVASYNWALEINPDFAEAHNNLGNALRDLGQLDEAAASYRRALKIRPDLAEAHSNLGNALRDLGQLDEAAASYCRALKIRPDLAEVHSNLGNAQKDLGQLDDAVASYRRALEIKSDYAQAHSNLGSALKTLGQLDDAVASYRRALEINPDFVEAHNNLGNALQDLGRLDDAAASYRRALEINPDFVEAHNNLGNAQKDLGRLDDAAASYRRALEIEPDLSQAHSNLVFIHNYLSDQPAAMLLAEARRFGELVARQARPYTSWQSVPETDRCLRVGLVSGDLCNHPVGYFAEGMLSALAAHASGRLELIAYPSHFRSDALTERIKACCRGWHSAVGLSDEALARRIHDEGIHILIDLSGHTAHNRLPVFAWKPAPVQASWLGYFATTGVAAMDYLIADPWTLPQAEEAHFTEKIWRLPETRLCFTPPDAEVDVAPLPALRHGRITFGCFNNLTKMNDAVVALWARVLSALPQSRLFLKAKQLADASVRQRVIERFAARGIDAERLILEGFAPRTEYLAAYQRVDVALDPFPYPGGTTSAESLWMGVPVLTLAGERFLSRQGVGLLTNAGLPEWIAADPEDYVARAVSHAGDLHHLATLRKGLRQQVLASPLFDAPRFARHFEAALLGMWAQWCNKRQGQPS